MFREAAHGRPATLRAALPLVRIPDEPTDANFALLSGEERRRTDYYLEDLLPRAWTEGVELTVDEVFQPSTVVACAIGRAMTSAGLRA
jgi:hypothetical protein